MLHIAEDTVCLQVLHGPIVFMRSSIEIQSDALSKSSSWRITDLS
jgi:hypothetical protein